MNKKILAIVVTVTVLAVILLLCHFIGVPNGDALFPHESTNHSQAGNYADIRWQMNAIWEDAYGNANNMVISVQGRITEITGSDDRLNLAFSFPDDFIYRLETPADGLISTNRSNHQLEHLYICATQAYNQKTQSNTSCVIAISLEQNSCMLLFEDSPNCCLTASVGKPADLQQVKAHFEDFYQTYSYPSWKEDGSQVVQKFPIHFIMSAAKYNTDGEEIKTVNISISGNKLDYLSGQSRLDVVIADFDYLHSFQASVIHAGDVMITGGIGTFSAMDYYSTYFTALTDHDSQIIFFEIFFSPDMDRWMLMNYSSKVFYVGSVSGANTTQELIEYFKACIPTNWSSS